MDKYRDTVLRFKELVVGKEFFCFDTETTGLSASENDIIQFSAIRYKETDGEYIETGRFDTYINPGYPIPDEITKITGITSETVKDAPDAFSAVQKIKDFLGEYPIVIGYNSESFDQGFINSLYRKTLKEDFTPAFHLDVIKMAREKFPRPHKLVDMAERAGVAEGVQFHSSLEDADVTFKVMLYLLPMYDKPEPKDDLDGFKVLGIRRWRKSDTLDRLYVGNSKGSTIYLDIPKGTWFIGINTDDDVVINAVREFAKVRDDTELVKKYA